LWCCGPTRAMVTSFLRFPQRRATVGRNPLDEWSVRRTDNTQQSQQKNIHEHDGIRTRNLGRQVAADIRLRPRGYWDRLSFSVWLILNTFHYTAVKEIDISPCKGGSFLLCFCCLFFSSLVIWSDVMKGNTFSVLTQTFGEIYAHICPIEGATLNQ